MLKGEKFERVGCERIMKRGDVKRKGSERARNERIILREKDFEKGGN